VKVGASYHRGWRLQVPFSRCGTLPRPPRLAWWAAFFLEIFPLGSKISHELMASPDFAAIVHGIGVAVEAPTPVDRNNPAWDQSKR
jgi:hypothetical protein